MDLIYEISRRFNPNFLLFIIYYLLVVLLEADFKTKHEVAVAFTPECNKLHQSLTLVHRSINSIFASTFQLLSGLTADDVAVVAGLRWL